MSVNKVILVGNVGADPEIRHLDGGVSVATIKLATSETYKNREGKKVTDTEWHKIVVWKGLAEVAEKYVKKGQLLYVEGKIKTKMWENDKGEKRYSTEIIASNFQMLGSKQDSKPQDAPSPPNNTSEPEPEDDLPF